MTEPELEQHELIRLAGHSIQRWTGELCRRFGPDHAASLMLVGALRALVDAHGPEGAADHLREAADRLDSGVKDARH
jgi:hypothetical protein